MRSSLTLIAASSDSAAVSLRFTASASWTTARASSIALCSIRNDVAMIGTRACLGVRIAASAASIRLSTASAGPISATASASVFVVSADHATTAWSAFHNGCLGEVSRCSTRVARG